MSAKNISEIQTQKDFKRLIIENRWGDRESIYSGDMPKLSVWIDQCSSPTMAHMVDLSAAGIGLCHHEFRKELINKSVTIKINPESKYSLEGTVFNFDQAQFAGRVENRIGVKFKPVERMQVTRPRRFTCPGDFHAIAYGEYPFKYNHTAHFQVLDFSFNGMTMRGSKLSDLLIPGLIIQLNILLPAQGTFKVDIQVTNIREGDEKNHFHAGCSFMNPTPELLAAISAYLLSDQKSQYSANKLRENGFLVSEVDEYVRFSYVSNKSEWAELLDLRLKAAQSEGRWLETDDPEDMVDDFDKYSRQLFCKIGDRMVGAARITFNDGDPARCEHSRYMEIPKFLFDGGVLELSRVSTLPGYRGVNLFPLIIQHGFRIGAQSRCRYGLINCEDSLVKIYQQLGAKSLGVSFTNKYMNGKRLNVLYFDLEYSLYGRKINPTIWYLYLKDVEEHLRKKEVVKPNFLQRMQVALLKIIVGTYINFILSKNIKNKLYRRDKSLLRFKQPEGKGSRDNE